MSKARPRRPGVPAAALMVLLAFMLSVSGASAGRAWCRTDPVIVVDGSVADVFVSAPLTSLALLTVTGPTQVEVTVPTGVDAWLLLSDLGFGRGEKVTFKESDDLHVTDRGVQMRVRVYVPARDSSLPVRVEFAPRVLGILWPASAEGMANQWIQLDILF